MSVLSSLDAGLGLNSVCSINMMSCWFKITIIIKTFTLAGIQPEILKNPWCFLASSGLPRVHHLLSPHWSFINIFVPSHLARKLIETVLEKRCFQSGSEISNVRLWLNDLTLTMIQPLIHHGCGVTNYSLNHFTSLPFLLWHWTKPQKIISYTITKWRHSCTHNVRQYTISKDYQTLLKGQTLEYWNGKTFFP